MNGAAAGVLARLRVYYLRWMRTTIWVWTCNNKAVNNFLAGHTATSLVHRLGRTPLSWAGVGLDRGWAWNYKICAGILTRLDILHITGPGWVAGFVAYITSWARGISAGLDTD
jgi:hypothetical protein